MSSTETLTAMRNDFVGKSLAETLEKMHRATDELRNSGIMERALNAGATMPEFDLPNTAGEAVNSADLLKKGNLVVTFYRGVW